MKKIVLLGVRYDNNMGDVLLFYCTEWMIRKFLKEEAEFVHLDFYGRTDFPKPEPHVSSLKKIAKTILLKFSVKQLSSVFRAAKEYKDVNEFERIKKYYEHNFKDADLIVVIGAGTFKYDVRCDFGPYYEAITECAKNMGIPCVVSCVGVESDYNAEDDRCVKLSRAISDDIIKIITTRDNIDEVRKYVKNPNTYLAKTADIAVWAAETYDIHKDENSDLMGIGVIAHNRFEQYHTDISKEEYEQTLRDIIERLEQNNEKWVMFNNGCEEDVEYAEYLCEMLGRDPKKYLLKAPQSPEELVRMISRFKGIITSRLHSCITAYSLDIPFVAISWNNKVKYFAQNIGGGYTDRVIEKDRLSADIIVDEFYKALKDGYDESDRKAYRQTIVEDVKKYITIMDK